MRKVYMDHGAGNYVDSRVLAAMEPFFLEGYGNPASPHSYSQDARRGMEVARSEVARLIGASGSKEVFFTSGATESNNWAIRGVAARSESRGRHIITTSIEHMSVINVCKYLVKQGYDVSYLPVDRFGVVDLEALEREMRDETILVSVMYANGEIGTVEPIKEAGEIVHRRNAVFHVDATAAMGQVQIDVQELGVDLMTLSSNDMYGPKGVGGLYIRDGTRLTPLIYGGGQERGLRSGTENLPSIVGMGKASELARAEMASENERITRLRDNFIKRVTETIPHSFLNGHPARRLPNNIAVRFSFIEGESMLLSLDMEGVAASSGSACTAKTLEPSHVLRAIGLAHEEAHGSLLFTLGRENTEEDMKYVTGLLPDIVKRLRALSPLTPKELRESV